MQRVSALAAAGVGAGVGVLGGLIGLGGAEFRLPLLIGFFANPVRRAIVLNLGVSLFTVLAALAGRLSVGSPLSSAPAHVIVAVMAGGTAGAYLGASWLAGASSRALVRGVRGLLAVIGALLLVEALGPGHSVGLIAAPVAQSVASVVAGVAIGIVSSLLGVAGGEMIIPTLVFGFGVDIKVAGTASLLISVPTMLTGLWRQAASGLWPTRAEVTCLVLPMSAGSVVGAVAGAALVGLVPGSVLKAILGLVLIWSATRLRDHPAGG